VAPGAQKLTVVVALALFTTWLGAPASQTRNPEFVPHRIVSLVPAVTEMLFAIGAGSRVVAVSSYDEFPPEVRSLPKVGALLDPDIERIFEMRPDMVVVYGSQSHVQTQLERAGLRTFSYRHGGVATTLDTIRELGDASGRRQEAAALVTSLQARLDSIRERVKGLPKPRTLLVFERQPDTLREIYASGGVGFLHEMLTIAGGTNVFADVSRESVQPSLETLLGRAPDVILEVRATGLLDRSGSAGADAWSAISSVPAVKNRRVHLLRGDYLVVPGPRLAMATEAFARALHPSAFR